MQRIWPIVRSMSTWLFAVLLVLCLTAYRGYQQNSWVPPTPTDPNPVDASFWPYFIACLKAPCTIFTQGRSDQLYQIEQHTPLSILFLTLSFVIAYVFGVLKGTADVFWKHRKGYKVIQAITWVIDAFPMFGVLALIELGSLFAYMTFGARDPVHFLPGNNFWDCDFLLSFILAFPPMMYISRLIRITIEQEMGEQYVLTARSKGLAALHIFSRHIYQNCLMKLVNEASTVFTMILSSLLILEYISWQWGGALDLFVSMGHRQLGESGSLLQDPARFDTPLVVDYLLIFAVCTIIFQVIAFLLKRKWQVTQNA